MSARARFHSQASRRPRGATLLIAMTMLLVIGLSSVAVMRSVTTAFQIATNARLQSEAFHNAQLALQFCEHQLEVAAPVASFQPAQDPPAWTVPDHWRGTGAQAAHTLGAGDFNGAGAPPVRPQCLLERTAWAGVYLVTARGFSPDYRAAPATGAALSGSAAWVQAQVWAPLPGQPLRARTWQQLLTPPL